MDRMMHECSTSQLTADALSPFLIGGEVRKFGLRT
jgi:hypothetical protein